MRIITYNIEYGGFKMRSDKITILVNMIERLKPDVVCFQEISTLRGNDITLRICEVLGWYYVRNRRASISIVSKHKIVKKHIELNYTNTMGVTIDIDGYLINIYNIHMNDLPGTPTTIKGVEYPDTPFIKNEKLAVSMSFSTKWKDLRSVMKSIKNNPVKKTIIVGDFNEPSHLDSDIPWKCSLFLQKFGFVDSMRALYKSPVKYPLMTYNTYNSEPYPQERIDLVYHQKLKPINLKLIPNKGLSDHRPVLVDYNI